MTDETYLKQRDKIKTWTFREYKLNAEQKFCEFS